MRAVFILLLLFSAHCLLAQHIQLLQQGKPTSIRGLSVVDDSVAWISGSKGYIAKTINGGKTWDWQQVKGFEKADFRDIEAFSDKEAIIMSSGTPALILKTTDGGANWQVKYRNTDTAYFFDAMDFDTPKHGLVLGDPIRGKFVLMETNNGGETWHPFKNVPDALPGEAAFAASGTSLKIIEGNINIITGGSSSRLLICHKDFPNVSNFWTYENLLIKHGKPSQGAFSLSGDIVVGGDYQEDKLTDSVAEYYYYNGSYAGGASYLSKIPPAGFQSCVENVSTDRTAIFLSTGTPGSNITTDGGKTWAKIDDASYNVCRKAKHGKLVLLAGNDGRIGVFTL